MPRYVVEREIPGIGKFTAEQLKALAEGSYEALNKMGPGIQWVNSYVTKDKLYCIYIAENEEIIREHGHQSGFPVKFIYKVSAMIDPTTAETTEE